MLSSEAFASILSLKRAKEGPTIVFIGIRLPEKTVRDLYQYYGVKSVLVSPTDLRTMNSDYGWIFALTQTSLREPAVIEELWRVAKEGAAVFILAGLDKIRKELETAKDYGFQDYFEGPRQDWPYSVGIVRKDLAKHFRS